MRFITEYAGRVKHKTTEDGENIEKIMVGENRIVYGCWSILERYKGRKVVITIEELDENTEIMDKTAVEFKAETKDGVSLWSRIARRFRG